MLTNSGTYKNDRSARRRRRIHLEYSSLGGAAHGCYDVWWGLQQMASFEELLVDAARGGNVVALDELLQEAGGGANVNLQTEGGVSLVMHAIIGWSAQGAYRVNFCI